MSGMERVTRQRKAVVDALARSGQALSPQDLLEHARSSVPTLNLSTVYRQLKGLEDAGTILRVDLPGQPSRFEMAARTDSAARPKGLRARAEPAVADVPLKLVDAHHHHHFHCVQCDRVYPIHACPGPMHHLAPPGFEVQRHDLTLRGRCAHCVAQGAAERTA